METAVPHEAFVSIQKTRRRQIPELRRTCFRCPKNFKQHAKQSKFTDYSFQVPAEDIIIVIIIIIITFEFSHGGNSPYTSTDETNKNQYA
jgi:hypothetical protein